jgi:hypothetical protein
MYTQHAEQRLRQRGISKQAVEMVCQFGQEECHRGRQIYSLRARQMGSIKAEFPSIDPKLSEKLHHIYVVMQGDLVITAAYINCRHKRNR